MFISEITDFKNKKVKIVFDNGIAFVLYKGDLVKYDLKEGEVSDNVYEEIMNELLPKRALNRSLKIITGHDMTEYMLSKKLKDDGYPDSIIENTVNVLKKERLINDERYIKGYIEAKSTKKSKRDILIALSQKGIDSKKAERIFEELCEEGTASDEKELIRKLLVKRHFDFDNADYGSKQKEIQYLLRKGFSFDSIEEAMNKPE